MNAPTKKKPPIKKYLANYQQEQRDFYEDDDEYKPEDYDIITWFRDNSPAYERLQDRVIEEITNEAESGDGYYNKLLDLYISSLEYLDEMEN